MKPVILQGPVLRERTTLRLGGKAIAEVRLDDMHSFDALPEIVARLGGEPAVMGRGSNILAKDEDLPLVIVNPALKVEPEVVWKSQDGQLVLVRAEAGVKLPVLLAKLAAWGLSGLEGLAGVPGTVGGAVAMNAGSYGCDIQSVLHSVEVFSQSTGMRTYDSGQCRCEYRHFSIPALQDWFVVAAVTLQLKVGNTDAIRSVMQHNIARKKATQPVTAHSAGCVFRNPEPGVSAGKLLDDAGFKGRELGGMSFSSLHANFLINHANGNSFDAIELIKAAQQAVFEKSGYHLQLEVKMWPWR
ncbi:UDP-N-acetylmuramate dehydrogenase [Oleidesulfovibrio sp.]|uniref:UDP-N-acetylmuramate dehydrogenase n=1 Tax=Oleidesulfovibrio sp. TaxID=2909707 RepID=UPI003A836AF9